MKFYRFKDSHLTLDTIENTIGHQYLTKDRVICSGYHLDLINRQRGCLGQEAFVYQLDGGSWTIEYAHLPCRLIAVGTAQEVEQLILGRLERSPKQQLKLCGRDSRVVLDAMPRLAAWVLAEELSVS